MRERERERESAKVKNTETDTEIVKLIRLILFISNFLHLDEDLVNLRELV